MTEREKDNNNNNNNNNIVYGGAPGLTCSEPRVSPGHNQAVLSTLVISTSPRLPSLTTDTTIMANLPPPLQPRHTNLWDHQPRYWQQLSCSS